MKTRRNIGIIAHIDAGKTTLSERLLFYTGREYRMGEVDEGTTKMDWMEEEQERGITIQSAATTFQWKDAQITLIDTPGHVDFTAEVERSLRVLDGAVGVFSGVEGVEAQSETVWRQADRYAVPRIAFVNKLDRVGADYFHVLDDIQKRLHCVTLPMIIPIGQENDFEGVIDLVTMKELRFGEESLGAKLIEGEIADDRRPAAQMWRGELIEKVAEGSDEIMAHYLNGEEVPVELLRRAIRAGTIARRWVPTFGGAAFRNKGVQPVLDAVVYYLPAPEDIPTILAHKPEGLAHKSEGTDTFPIETKENSHFSGLLFKVQVDSHGELYYVRIYSGKLSKGDACISARTGKKERVGNIYRMHANDREPIESAVAGDIVAITGLRFSATGDTLCTPARPILLEPLRFPQTVISVAVEPRSSADRDKLLEQLNRIAREDPTLNVEIHPETGQVLLSGMGELHLEVTKNRLLREFGVDANVGKPRVSYRQTLRKPARSRAHFERTLGGKDHLGDIELAGTPDTGLAGCEVEWEDPGLIAKPMQPRVVEAARDCATSGGLCGFPYIQLRLRLKALAVTPETTELGLALAVKEAFEALEREGEAVLLEPVMHFQILTPDEYYGAINQDLMRRRATIEDVVSQASLRKIQGRVPLSEVFGYTTDLRSISQGRASMSLEPIGYVPASEKDAERFRY